MKPAPFEVFVFLAGYAAVLAYGKILARERVPDRLR